jgi:hypothetical protein
MYEYEKCFQPLLEKGASRHLVTAEDPNLIIAIDTLVQGGAIVGQGEMFSQDIIYFLNPERVNPCLQIVSEWKLPQVLYEQQHLARPIELKSGVTKLI